MLNLKKTLAYYIAIAVASDLLGFYYIGTALTIPILFFLILINKKISKSLLVSILPFIVLILIGTFRFGNGDLVTFGKDFWVFSRVPIAMTVGYVFFNQTSPSRAELRKIITIPSLAYALVQLSHFIADPSLITQTATTIRAEAGNGGVYITIGLIVSLCGMGDKRRSLSSAISRNLVIVILFSALILSFSRALILFFLIVAFFVFWRKKHWKYVFVVAPLTIVGAAVLFFSLKNDVSNLAGGSFVEKLARAGSEITISDYQDQQDINLNWRGYESYMALKHYENGNLGSYLFGFGFGELVDVGLFIKLGDEDLRFVPYFHNGYLYLLIKTGALGLLLYLVFVLRLFLRFREEKNRWPEGHPVYFYAGLAQGVLVGSLCMTYIITGLFNKGDGLALSLLLGGILAVTRSARETTARDTAMLGLQQ